MKKTLNVIFIFLLIFPLNLSALNRDYKSDCDEELLYQQYYSPCCLVHIPTNIPMWMDEFEINLLPTNKIKCSYCHEKAIYMGYFDEDFQKYYLHLNEQIRHFHKHRNCKCNWPELSKEAAEISDFAYVLFRDFITTTAFKDMLNRLLA